MTKAKHGFTLDEQISHLKTKKNIDFENEENEDMAKKYLEKYSYSDIINPIKVLFCSGYNENDKFHEYKYITKWNDIEDFHKELKKVEVKVFGIVMQLELEMKAKLNNYIATEIKSNTHMDFKVFLEKLETKSTEQSTEKFYQRNEKKFAKRYERDYPDYKNTSFVTRWYLFIMSLSVGELIKILRANYNRMTLFQRIEFKKLDYKQLIEFNILRNSLAHGTSILIFLDKPLRMNEYKKFEKRQKLLIKLLEGHIERHGIIVHYDVKRNNLDGKRVRDYQLSEYKI